MRGVQKINSKTVTSSMLGNFRCTIFNSDLKSRQGRPEDEGRVPDFGKRLLNFDGGFNFHFVFIANITVIRFQIN